MTSFFAASAWLFSAALFLASCASPAPSTQNPGDFASSHEMQCAGPSDALGRQGRWLCRDKEGNLLSVIEYQNGQKEGWFRHWLKDGTPDVANEWKEGVMHGRALSWHRNGILHIAQEYRHGRPHGLMREWDSQGRQIVEMPFVDGSVEGLVLEWDPEGRLKSRTLYRQGHPVR